VSSPAMVDSQPDYVQRFLRAVPVAWDETRFVDGYPGRLAVLARRRGTEWYLGGINGDTSVAVAEIPLTFLAPAGYDVGLIADGEDDRSYQYATERLTNRDTITVEIAPRGGFAARLVLRRPSGASGPASGRAPSPARRTTSPRPRPRG
jgi:alpha-glucosidase